MVKHNKYWFKPKRIGWGISYPISWEGWLITLILAVLVFSLWYLNGMNLKVKPVKNIVIFVVEVIAILSIFIYLVRRRVEGGLKWRSFRKN